MSTKLAVAVVDAAARRPLLPGVGGEKVVETHGLTKRYGTGIIAVDSLDLNVYRGEVYGFLGPNGAGKTTTLRMLLGLIRPTAGSATVVGAAPGTPASLVRVGAIVETPAFYPYLSGYDNLRLLARYCGVAASRVDAALAEVDLTPRARHKFSTYSLGMKQRLGIAAALLKEPELLILDEPTNGLDPQGMADVRNLIIELGKGERTVLISSHLLGEVEQMCTRVGVIRKGKIVAEGTVDQLRGAPTLTVRGTPEETAKAILVQVAGADNVTALGDATFSLVVDLQRTAEINQHLVQAGVAVTELHADERSLEDVFMELTGTEGGL
ncbi:MAG TPA: ABC transporter ATP-binding protein [Candidatus Dormibacteraeota bacterium]|nr:ABC transporter ATP-binding protein [Candidatus Dormibacteraeota bacterium]